MPAELNALADVRLIDAEAGLHAMFKSRLDAGVDTADVEATHDLVAAEMRKRHLMYEPLAKMGDGRPLAPVTHPSTDDGLRQKGKTKSGKGSDEGRTQDDIDDPAGEGGVEDPDAAGDAGPIVKKAVFPTDWESFAKAAKDGAPTPHAFVPVRNICRVCRGGAEDHVAKSNGTDGSIFKALPSLDVDARRGMAEQGIAMPDGSFPIPDEAHLHAAIRLVGQADDPQAAMNHIIERAKAMGMQEILPPAWNVDPNAAPETPQVGPGAHNLPGPAGPGAGQPGAGKPSMASGAAAGGQSAAGAAGSGGKPAAPGLPAAAASPSRPKSPLMKRMMTAVAKAMGADFDATAFEDDLTAALDPSFEYAVVKSAPEQRYTLGPVYMPSTYDAHEEWATAEDLQKAAWDYVRETGGDRTIFLQHSDKPAGEWVEIMAWPHPVSASMTKAVDGVQKAITTEFPAGTVYMGVVWQPWAYEDVKKGKITGFSMGGMAQRVEAHIE